MESPRLFGLDFATHVNDELVGVVEVADGLGEGSVASSERGEIIDKGTGDGTLGLGEADPGADDQDEGAHRPRASLGEWEPRGS